MKHENPEFIAGATEGSSLPGEQAGSRFGHAEKMTQPSRAPQWSLRTMGIDGYMAKVQEHLDRLGFAGNPPSQKRYVDAWNGQTCAKKLAASHIRRSRRQ